MLPDTENAAQWTDRRPSLRLFAGKALPKTEWHNPHLLMPSGGFAHAERWLRSEKLAEDVGFEPTIGLPISVFKTDAIGH